MERPTYDELMDGQIKATGKPDEFRHTTAPAISNFLNPVIDLKNPRFKQLENSHE